ncbi:hypothetical protein EV421DRAFT_1912426 [Armillaria borealis]|uniref:SEC63 domain-containing protein n=1 Tax=Armillaria borealis TaxID=47425 RepID=A0AA39IXC2_9AGAR|nr:hypothetical protein EV421DRAFT_1912426 [Armillaria borealis]
MSSLSTACLSTVLRTTNQTGLKEMLKNGIGYFREAVDRQDKRIVQRLSESGAYYEGKEHRYMDDPTVMDPADDGSNMLTNGVQIVVKTIENNMDILTWTYFYRWMMQTPRYHNLLPVLVGPSFGVGREPSSRSRQLQVYGGYANLFTLAISLIFALEDEMDISALNPGMVAAYYNISFLAADQKIVLEKMSNLLSACVDDMSSSAWLSALLGAMDLAQMCVQALWDRDSPLRQVPHSARVDLVV